MAKESELAVFDPYWKTRQGIFLPFSEQNLSYESQEFIKDVKTLNASEHILIRGSFIETQHPFKYSDLDIFVIYTDHRRQELYRQLQDLTNRILDLKWVKADYLQEDFVYYALLAHRSLQITGDPLTFTPLNADRDFAWKHWVKYFPVGLPDLLNSSEQFSVIFFKQLIRCFGVIEFLKNGQFTRDIGACINFAKKIEPSMGDQLYQIRNSIETKEKRTNNIIYIKNKLRELFDVFF